MNLLDEDMVAQQAIEEEYRRDLELVRNTMRQMLVDDPKGRRVFAFLLRDLNRWANAQRISSDAHLVLLKYRDRLLYLSKVWNEQAMEHFLAAAAEYPVVEERDAV